MIVKKAFFPALCLISTLVFTAMPSHAISQQFCFSYASSLYEQVYCELQAEGYGERLPSFYDFKKNSPQMQYLLLKPQVRKLAMKLPKPMPKKKARQQHAVAAAKKSANNTIAVRKPLGHSPQQAKTACTMEKDMILCGDSKHVLQYNQNNKALAADIFSAENTMDLPRYTGGDKNQYLAKAYAQYIDKMLSLGLAGVTLSYNKFYHLFDELQQRNMDFAKRFETMYFYLKKDKKSMMVNTQKIIPKQLSLEQCDALHQYWICATRQNNYIFKRI